MAQTQSQQAANFDSLNGALNTQQLHHLPTGTGRSNNLAQMVHLSDHIDSSNYRLGNTQSSIIGTSKVNSATRSKGANVSGGTPAKGSKQALHSSSQSRHPAGAAGSKNQRTAKNYELAR